MSKRALVITNQNTLYVGINTDFRAWLLKHVHDRLNDSDRGLLESLDEAAIRSLRTVYTIPHHDNDQKTQRLIDDNVEHILLYELAQWLPFEDLWPEQLDMALLKKWFTVEVCKMDVFELSDEN